MRIRSIRLQNFRGVVDSTVNLVDGVTIVEGPNEVGKSSLMEAVRLMRTTKDSSKSAEIRALRPVGRDVGPEVWLELTTGPYELRFHKRWLKQTTTELHVTAPRSEQLTGGDAHDRFLQILDETLDTSLLDALEVVQGQSLDQPHLARITALHRALEGSDAALDEHDDLMARLDAEYEKYFTGTGKKTGEYRQVSGELDALQARVDELKADSKELDGYSREYRRQEDKRASLEGRRTEDRRILDDVTGRDAGVRELKAVYERSSAALEAAQRESTTATERLEARRQLVANLEQRNCEVLAQQAELARATDLREPLEAARDKARQDEVDAESTRDKAKGRAAAAQTTARRRRDQDDLAEQEGRLQKAQEASESRSQADNRLKTMGVDSEALEKLVALDQEVRLAVATREAAAATLVVTPLGQGHTVLVDERAVDHRVEVPVVESATVVEVPGVVRIEARPARLPETVETNLASAREALAQALADAGVETLDQAREVARQRRELERQRDRADTTLASLLPNTDLDALVEQVGALRAGLDGVDRIEEDAKSLDELARQTKELAESAERDAETARDALKRAEAAWQQSRDAILRGEALVQSAEAERDRARAELETARENQDDTSLEEAATLAERQAEDRRLEVEEAARALADADPDGIAAELENAQAVLKRRDQELNDTRSELTRLRALIDDRESRGIWTQYQDATAALDAATTRFQRLDRAAQAVEMLRQVMTTHRQSAQETYVAPFKERIDRLGRTVFGKDFAAEISTDLQLTDRTLAGRTVPFASLSAGAREQLALLGRLACAQLVDAEEGAPVVLDDTLGFADPDRLYQLNVLLHEVGGTAQIIVLTCQPERFAQVGGATVVSIHPEDT